MKLSTHTRWLVTALVFTGIAAPAAQAAPPHAMVASAAASDWSYPEGFTLAAPSTQLPATGWSYPEGFTLAAPSTQLPATGWSYPEGFTLAAPSGESEQAPIQVVRRDGFDFGDAGIGAGFAAALLLLACAAVLATRRHRRLAHQ